MTIRRSLLQGHLRAVKRAAYDPRIVSQVLQSRIAQPLEVGARDARWSQLEDTLELLDREVAYRKVHGGDKRTTDPAPELEAAS
jgi:hypothetical protein